MYIIKRNGTKEEVDTSKIKAAIMAAFKSVDYKVDNKVYNILVKNISLWDNITVEDIQDEVIETLRDFDYDVVADAYQKDRERKTFVRERLEYMNKYCDPKINAASSSETDANSNVSMKNVANLEGEVYKTTNRLVQRAMEKQELYNMYGSELTSQYKHDIDNHIIYVHDEASSPVIKFYCGAYTLYPLMTDGVGNIDGVTPFAPNDILSFNGQVTNLVFLLSSQTKGAVALGDYFIALNYYVIQEFGEHWYNKVDEIITSSHCIKQQTILHAIRKGMKQFIYGVNQPAGNRSYNSPFTNVSFYDSNYFNSMFGDFYYPDGTKPEWTAIDKLQRIFMKLHRDLRLIKPLTFPVTTMALVNDGKNVIDKSYKELCAEEWAKGGSFFCYTSDNPSSLASCCRVLNEMSENTFSSTTGMTGIMTGSCNVITLDLNRIIQDWANNDWTKSWKTTNKEFKNEEEWNNYRPTPSFNSLNKSQIKKYLIEILERVYKYHIAFKTMLYNMEDKKMFAASNAGYLYIKKLYSTIGVIGYFEAAKYLGIETTYNKEYVEFLQLILGTIKEQNKLHSIHDKKRPFLFNTEAIPGENVAIKMYNWDKADGYVVPKDQNLYNCYFYNPWDKNTSILDKLKLHGREINKSTDGGQACHLNLDTHLSKEQYLKLIDVAIADGTNYFTFNIPMSECADCGHIVNSPIKECPICGSKHIKYWTRIIGYLTCVDNWSKGRQLEFNKRNYSHE